MATLDYTQPPTAYTPTTGSTPTFGQSGDSVKALQTSINEKNAGVAGYVPLKVDGLYGPKTYAAAQAGSNLISTSGSARSTFSQNSSDLQKAEEALGITAPGAAPTPTAPGAPAPAPADPNNPTPTTPPADPILSGLDTLKTANDNASNSLIESTKSSYQNKLNTLDKEFDNYSRGLQLLGIQTGQAQATPDLLLGHIHQAALDHMDKINALKAEEAKTIMDAKTAQANNDFKTLADKTERLKEISDEKQQAVKDLNTAVTSQAQVAAVEAHDIYDTLQTLNDEDKEAFLQAVAKKFNIPLVSLVTAIADEKSKRAAADLKTENTQSTIDKRNAPPKPKTPSPTQKAKDEVEVGKNVLKTGVLPDGTKLGNPQGTDGFYDPGVYIKLFQSWKGTPKEFIAKYPIIGSVNPASYNLLPQALQSLLPKSKSSGRTS